jgi:hypothetical protein
VAVDTARWKKRIEAARRRRQQYESDWAQYAMLHAKSYTVKPDLNDDEMVTLPSGDQVRLGLIHANIEQTMALLEMPEIGVKAQAMDYTRELGYSDTHREAVVEQALVNSAKRSGLIKHAEEVDYIKRDGVVIGHGICYTWYRIEERTIETGQVQVFEEGEDGSFQPVYDEETGEPLFEPITETVAVWQAVQDEHVPVLEFLFDATAARIDKASWQGREQVVKLDELRQDVRYRDAIPDDIEPQAFRVRDLYGNEQDEKEMVEADSVKKIVIWDKSTHTLLTFLECVKRKEGSKQTGKDHDVKTDLLLIGEEPWPITFSHPDASPFTAFVPIPANDLPFGISQIEHTRNPATEADKIRTRQANITRQIKRITLVRDGLVDETKMQQAIKSPDMSVVTMKIPEDFDKNRDIIELQPPNVHPDLYNQEAKAKDTVREVSGVSEVPFGGASTATESEHMWNIGGARVNRKRAKYQAFLGCVLARHLDFLREMGPEGSAVQVIGDDGLPTILPYGRDALQGEFDITVMAGGEAMAASPVEQKTMIEFMNTLLGRFGPAADRQITREVGTRFNIRGINAIIGAIPSVSMMMQTPGVDGRLRQDGFNPNDTTPGQAVRRGVNAPNEG